VAAQKCTQQACKNKPNLSPKRPNLTLFQTFGPFKAGHSASESPAKSVHFCLTKPRNEIHPPGTPHPGAFRLPIDPEPGNVHIHFLCTECSPMFPVPSKHLRPIFALRV
jgi:hypothetical protein